MWILSNSDTTRRKVYDISGHLTFWRCSSTFVKQICSSLGTASELRRLAVIAPKRRITKPNPFYLARSSRTFHCHKTVYPPKTRSFSFPRWAFAHSNFISNKTREIAIKYLDVCGAMEAPDSAEATDSATFEPLHKEHIDAEESLYLLYLSETPSPSLKWDLSDSLSTYLDVPVREQFARLDIVPLLSKSDDIKSPLQSVELPLKGHLLSPRILHQHERSDAGTELKRVVWSRYITPALWSEL